RVQRPRDRWRLDPYPSPRHSGAGVRGDGHRQVRSGGEVRILVERIHLWRAPTRRHRIRLGPHYRSAGQNGFDPRGDRVSEDWRRRRPADRCARADHFRAAQGGRHRRHRKKGREEMSEIPDPVVLKGFNAKLVEEFRANGGKVSGPFEGADLLVLTTTGAKSGQPRVSPLAYQRVDGKLLIIGSYRGADIDPAWVHNLR